MTVWTRRWRLRSCSAVLPALLVPAVLLLPGTAAADPVPRGAGTAGTVIAVRDLPAHLWIPGAAEAHRIEYRTEWRSGESTPATGAVFLPPGPPPEGGWPVVAWGHGTTGMGDDCAHTTAFPRGVRENAYLGHWLDAGYALVAADYPGLGSEGLHRYLDGPSAANSIVDLVRAAHTTGAPLSDRWVVLGQSQGGHAALHTGAVATRRAPELDFRGTVATGAPANLEKAYLIGIPDFPDLGLQGLVSFSSYIFAALREAYPDADVDSYLTPVGREIVDRAEEMCLLELEESVRGVKAGEVLARPLSQPPLPALLQDYLSVPVTGYDRPVLLAHGVKDAVVPLPLSAAHAAEMRAAGADVDYRVYDGGHGSTMELSLPDVEAFIARVLAD
ncbi:lipase [Rhodococcus sp. Z13]|uniref:Lipase n=1 Tax=Rhodococcus sacchari TaxID=2962047 RepID=A0ACD4DK04_9NOCA|nr:lipase family protein [Rhodococcus sp. Z13]UYP20394.1 lipase [Rhodococcus sp. Z13]